MAARVLAGSHEELNSPLTAILIKIHVLVSFLEEPSILLISILFDQDFIMIKHLTQPLPLPEALPEAFPRKILP